MLGDNNCKEGCSVDLGITSKSISHGAEKGFALCGRNKLAARTRRSARLSEGVIRSIWQFAADANVRPAAASRHTNLDRDQAKRSAAFGVARSSWLELNTLRKTHGCIFCRLTCDVWD